MSFEFRVSSSESHSLLISQSLLFIPNIIPNKLCPMPRLVVVISSRKKKGRRTRRNQYAAALLSNQRAAMICMSGVRRVRMSTGYMVRGAWGVDFLICISQTNIITTNAARSK